MTARPVKEKNLPIGIRAITVNLKCPFLELIKHLIIHIGSRFDSRRSQNTPLDPIFSSKTVGKA